MGYLIAFPLALLCGLFLALDLGQPLRFWHMFVYSRTLLPSIVWDSPISVGAYALIFFSLFAFLSFVDALRRRNGPPSSIIRKIYAIPGGLFGLFLASYTGVLLAQTHLPVWAETPLLGALFAASSASTGLAAIALGLALTRTDLSAPAAMAQAKLNQVDNVALILELVLLIVFLVWLGSDAVPIVTGLNGILLIGGTVLAGLLVPLVLQARSGSRNDETRAGPAPLTTLTALLILIGGFLMRTVIVMGGQGLL
jgi:formate-dependent nitrite reductase membrane component NrfD